MLLEIIHQIVAAKPHVQYAIAPLLAAGLISAIPSVIKTVSGIRQTAAAKKAEKKLKRPELNVPQYEIPGQVKDVTKRVKLAALDTSLPGADIMKSEIDASTAGAISDAQRSGTSSSDILATIASMGAKGAQLKRGINIEGAKRYDEMQSDINRALMTEAGYEDRKQALDKEKYMSEFEYNKDQPYKSKAAEISALRGAGNQNIYSGVTDLASLGTTLAMQGMFNKQAAPAQAAATTPAATPQIVQRSAPLGPPTFNQWSAGQPSQAPATQAAVSGMPINNAGFGAGRLSNQFAGQTGMVPPAPQTTMGQAMMGQYFPQQQGGSWNYITGVPAAALAPIKPSWYYSGANPYYMYNYLSNPSGQNYSGMPLRNAVGPREQ